MPDLLDELASTYCHLGRFDDALTAMREAIDAGAGGQPDVRCRIAEILMRAGRVDEAEPIWLQVRAETPDATSGKFLLDLRLGPARLADEPDDIRLLDRTRVGGVDSDGVLPVRCAPGRRQRPDGPEPRAGDATTRRHDRRIGHDPNGSPAV